MASGDGHRSRTSKRRIEEQARKVAALELRRQGRTFQEIAAELGYSDKSAAYNAVTKALEERIREPAEAVLALELERLDALVAANWDKAMEGNDRNTHAVLRVMDRRAKLLGLDDYENRMATVAERRVALEEAQALIVVSVLRQVLDRLDLSPMQREEADAAIPAVLRLVADDPDDDGSSGALVPA